MTAEERQTFCRIVGTLLLSDLKLRDTELSYLAGLYERLGVSDEEQRAIQAMINLRDDVAALAESLPEAVRRELLTELKQASMVDGELAETEVAIIEAVEAVLV